MTFFAVAGPWYALVYARSGAAFVQTFFWEQHVGRFASAALQHAQPVWFYIPVLDCLRLIPLRLRRHRSPFKPDREHFHYRLSTRVGETWAIAIYAGTVGVTSLMTTLVPQLAFFALTLASTVYFGFLLADTLARTSGKGQTAETEGNVVALARKLAKGPRTHV